MYIHNVLNAQIYTKVQQGEPLDRNDIGQMLHTGELLQYRASNDAERRAAQTYQTHAMKAIIGNQLMHAPHSAEGIQYEGHTLPAEHAPHIIEADIHHQYQTDQPLPRPIVENWPNTSPPVSFSSVLNPTTPPNSYARRDYAEVSPSGF